MKRRTLALILGLILAFGLTACGGSDESDPAETVENQVEEPAAQEDTDIEISETDQIEADLRKIIEDNYTSTEVDSIALNENLGTEDDDSDYVALVYLTWSVKNTPDTTKQMLALYSEDFAAKVGEDIPSITDFAIFWTVPYYSETDTAAKYSYERNGSGMYETDAVFSGVIK